VGRFIIYDDDSSDDPWSVLQKYVALGIVEYHDLRVRVPQMMKHATWPQLLPSRINQCEAWECG
jgi:hypothetical protein